jgi:hypothetical protein
MGITATATAKERRLKRNADRRAERRIDSDTFKAAEQMSRDKYNEFTKLSRAFVRAYPNEFKNFLMAHSRGAVARQSFGLPRHIPPVVSQSSTPAEVRPPIQLPDFRSVSSSGRTPTAQQNENSRLSSAAVLTQLGIRLD